MALHLYNFALQKSSAVSYSICGNFVSSDVSDILIAKGHILELLRINEFGRLSVFLSTEVFGVIRSLATSSLPGVPHDYIIVGSDSGKISILAYNKAQHAFVKVHEEVFGRSGIRRIVPGQFLATDPSGRAVMIAAIEKQKFVYVLNRDELNLTISSPLEAHKSHVLVYDVIGLDVGFDFNPVFVAIELDYSKADSDPTGIAAQEAEKVLTFYELDLSLNNMSRKQSVVLNRSAHRLIAVPSDNENPGGFIVCAKNEICYYNKNATSSVSFKLPQRKNKVNISFDCKPDNQSLIVAHTLLKTGKGFFFFIQTEYGDLFRVWLTCDGAKNVTGIYASYFNTVPVATAISVIPPGYLYVASETGNQYVYCFQQITPLESVMEVDEFEPHDLDGLILSDEIPCLTPVLDLKVENVDHDTKQLITLCGSGPRSSCRILRHGIAISEAAQVKLRNSATSIWVLSSSASEEYDQYIIVSFAESTLVLVVGESVEEIQSTDSLYPFFDQSVATLNIGRFHDDSFVQITHQQIRHYRNGKHLLWTVPDGHKIVHSAINERQVVISLNGGQIHYFELDHSNRIREVQRVSTNKEITALALQPVPPNQQRGSFLAVADSDKNVRIYSLEQNNCLNHSATQILSARASSLCLISIVNSELMLAIGTCNGLFLRCSVDLITGSLSSPRTKFLGTRPVGLFPLLIDGKKQALLALSSRSWLLHSNQPGSVRILPLSCVLLDYASSFNSKLCPESIVCSTNERLRIITIERLADTFNQTEIPLRYTPRQSAIHNISKHLLIVESDYNSYSEKERKSLGAPALHTDLESDNFVRARTAHPDLMYGVEQPGPGKWGSCIRVLDLVSQQTVDLLELDDNEAAFSICTCRFKDRGTEIYICVGIVKDLVLPSKKFSKACIRIYTLENNRKIKFVHERQVEGIPTSLACIKSRLFAGINNVLKVFDLGKKSIQLLRKIETSNFPNQIVTISHLGERIVVGDLKGSVHYVRYSATELTVIADDVTPRWITSVEMLDYNTIACSDKFGNIAVLRLRDKDAKAENDPNRPALLKGYLQGAPYKLEIVCHYYVGETVTRIMKTQLSAAGCEFLLYVTITGEVGALLSLASREDVDFFAHLEMTLRQDNPPLCGRDHLAYRSAYFPVKNVIDGELCEQFSNLTDEKKNSIALKLEKDVSYIFRKVEDIKDQI